MQSWSRDVFAKNLRHYLAQSGVTQKELAQAVGVSAPTMHDWVKGRKFPRIDRIEKMAAFFGIQKSDLIESEKPATDNGSGLSKSQRELMRFAEGLSEEEAAQVLQTMKLLVQGLRK